MTKVPYLFAVLTLAVAGCTASPQGSYQLVPDNRPYHLLKKFDLTGSKFITRDFLGETAMDYTVEDGDLYVQTVGTQYRFQVVSADTIRNDGGMGLSGTYVRAK